jgi:hypothetical protein
MAYEVEVTAKVRVFFVFEQARNEKHARELAKERLDKEYKPGGSGPLGGRYLDGTAELGRVRTI